MSDGVRLSVGATNLAAVVVGRTAVTRTAVVTLYPHRPPEVGVPSENRNLTERGLIITAFVDRVGDPVGIVASDGSTHRADALLAEGLRAMLFAVGRGLPPAEPVGVTYPAHWRPPAVDALRTALATVPEFSRPTPAPLVKRPAGWRNEPAPRTVLPGSTAAPAIIDGSHQANIRQCRVVWWTSRDFHSQCDPATRMTSSGLQSVSSCPPRKASQFGPRDLAAWLRTVRTYTRCGRRKFRSTSIAALPTDCSHRSEDQETNQKDSERNWDHGGCLKALRHHHHDNADHDSCCHCPPAPPPQTEAPQTRTVTQQAPPPPVTVTEAPPPPPPTSEAPPPPPPTTEAPPPTTEEPLTTEPPPPFTLPPITLFPGGPTIPIGPQPPGQPAQP